MKVAKLPSTKYALTNFIYLNPKDANKFAASKYIVVQGDVQRIYCYEGIPDMEEGSVGFNQIQRGCLNVSLGQVVSLSVFPEPRGARNFASEISWVVGFQKPKSPEKSFKVELLEEVLHLSFSNQMFVVGQDVAMDVAGTTLKFKVSAISCLEIDGDEDTALRTEMGILIKKTVFNFTKAKDSAIKISGQAKQTTEALFGPHFNFEQMGIGGLDKEFGAIFRRAFASRVFPADVVEKLGIQHVKGLLLYGPPGTGKTLIARKIGEMLNARPPKLVNGPEILNKYVGQSEENIRLLFQDAEREYKEKGEESELHIIIFDELDAICKERGTGAGGGTGVGDTVVNQLLSKLDGVDRINNVLVIGMTNRKDMIDEALLRPGRLEVHMEIGLPDERGRVQILKIHTAKMRSSNYMDDSVNIEELASLTKNYSGAEIEGLVKSATSFALNRQIDASNLKKPDPNKIRVVRDDFLNALQDVRPAFGVPEDTLAAHIRNGIIDYSPDFVQVFNSGKLFIQQVQNSDRTPVISLLLAGKPGAGKTALAVKWAIDSGFPFIKMLSPDNFVGYTEIARVNKINKAFEDAYKSKASLIIVDEIERLLDYTHMGPRFSNTVLQALLVLFKKHPPKNQKLLIIGTTSNLDVLREMSFLSSCNSVLEIPSLTSGQDVCNVLNQLGQFSTEDLKLISRNFSGAIEIKPLLTLAETAIQASGGTLGDRFLEVYKQTKYS
uniref:Vesicle-fusing ATPase n=1 Tax=Arcella intermedia TaxID=1963864 RepID=A0A6B2KYK5_9EUKA